MGSSIWVESDAAWKLLAPVGFPDEATLHDLIGEAPELLPLSGSPRLVVLGNEVSLGSGSADILAVEPSGRLVLIEVKLARNAEARRAVVAQILAYAAYLRGTLVQALEDEILRRQLRERGYETIAALAASEDPEGTFDEGAFANRLDESLSTGRFRLVLVLDDAPSELVRLVGYLESIAPELVIDLVAMSAYEINGARALVPQRIEPEREAMQTTPPPTPPGDGKKQGYRITPEEFEESIADAPEDARPHLRQMLEWARGLERDGTLHLLAARSASGMTTLRPCLLNEDTGLITVWNEQRFSITLWRTVFERRAPASIERIEALIPAPRISHGTVIHDISEELLDALADAYREAARLS